MCKLTVVCMDKMWYIQKRPYFLFLLAGMPSQVVQICFFLLFFSVKRILLDSFDIKMNVVKYFI